MDERFVPAERRRRLEGLDASVLAMAPLAASLAIFDEVGMPALRSRSVALTGYLADLLDGAGRRGHHPARSGRQGRPAVAAVRVGDARRGRARAASPPAGSSSDFRAPDLIRLAPMPLYTSYHEAWAATARLREALAASTRGSDGVRTAR